MPLPAPGCDFTARTGKAITCSRIRAWRWTPVGEAVVPERECRMHRRYPVGAVLVSTSIGRLQRVQSCAVDGPGAVNGTNREQRFWERVDRVTPRLGQTALKYVFSIH